jgi:uncharacterized protein (TIGR03118 family)
MGDEGDSNKLEVGNSTDDQAQSSKPSTEARVVMVTPLARDVKVSGEEHVNIVPSLVNAWGMAVLNQKFWIAGNGSGAVPILDGDGVPSTGPSVSGKIKLEKGITGVATTGAGPNDNVFAIHTDRDCRPSQVLFVSETGAIFGVNTDLDPNKGFLLHTESGAVFKGAAILQTESGPLLLAADFKNRRVDVFDSSFTLMSSPFTDVAKSLPMASERLRFSPFNVMTSGDDVFIAFAAQDPKMPSEEVKGDGLGFVVQLNKAGKVIAIAKNSSEHGKGELDAPWGMVVTCNFGPARNALLVGNFGNGHITAFDLHNKLTSLGQLETQKGEPVMIDGLWDLSFGTGVQKARSDELFFTAGPKDETQGLFGKITPAESEDGHKH